MSCARGNNSRSRAQKHQNKTAFKNNLHDTSNKTKFLNSLKITGVCTRCKEIIEWKIKYKKYKPIAVPTKCVGCEQKTVKFAYHVLCIKCSSEKNVCAKCCTSITTIEREAKEEKKDNDVMSILKSLPERKRRSILRYINKQDKQLTDVNLQHIEDILSTMDDLNINEDKNSLSNEDSQSDDESRN